MGREFREEIEREIKELRDLVEKLASRVEELKEAGDLQRAYKVWTEGMVEVLRRMKDLLERLEARTKESGLGEHEIREHLEYLREELRGLLSRMEDVTSRLKRSLGRGVGLFLALPEGILRSVMLSVGGTVEGLAESIGKLVESLEEGLARPGRAAGRVTQVVSVRMRERDLDVVDRLVEAGIFKSRSEAVSYFARRGIEVSREWIERALEQAKKIRELRESIRRELGDLEELE